MTVILAWVVGIGIGAGTLLLRDWWRDHGETVKERLRCNCSLVYGGRWSPMVKDKATCPVHRTAK